MTKSESIKDLAAALSKAQGEIKGAHKDSNNPYFKSNYADLASVWDAIREPFSKHGLSIVQSPGDGTVETLLMHESGEWVQGTLKIDAVRDAVIDDKTGKFIHWKLPTPQATGSAITYGRRYALQSFAGVAPIDDDGEAAMARTDDHREHSAMVVAKAQSKAPSEAPRAQEGHCNWKSLEVHFGNKLKGLQVGSLKNDQLKWLNEEWNPGENPKYPITAKDKALKEAVLKEMESRNIDQSPDSGKVEDDLGWGQP